MLPSVRCVTSSSSSPSFCCGCFSTCVDRASRAAAALLFRHAAVIRSALAPSSPVAAAALSRLCTLVDVTPLALALAGNVEAIGLHRLPPALGRYSPTLCPSRQPRPGADLVSCLLIYTYCRRCTGQGCLLSSSAARRLPALQPPSPRQQQWQRQRAAGTGSALPPGSLRLRSVPQTHGGVGKTRAECGDGGGGAGAAAGETPRPGARVDPSRRGGRGEGAAIAAGDVSSCFCCFTLFPLSSPCIVLCSRRIRTSWRDTWVTRGRSKLR